MQSIKIQVNQDGWGPSIKDLPPFAEDFQGLMFAMYDKSESSGKLCDFLTAQGRKQIQNMENQYGLRDGEGDNAFTYVESNTGVKSKASKTWKPQQKGRKPGMQPSNQQYAHSNYTKSQQSQWAKKQQQYHHKQQQLYQARNKMYKQPSFPIQSTWISLKDFNKHHFQKQSANAFFVQNILDYGQLLQYNQNMERITSKKPLGLRHLETEFQHPFLLQDSNIQELAEKNVADIYITDEALAILMTAPRSVYSWDLTVNKMNQALFIDYSQGSKTQFVSVNQNSSEPPPCDVKQTSINHPSKLHLEATAINYFFKQHVLNNTEMTKKYSEENDFKERYNNFPNQLFRYRLFKLGQDMKLCVRCTVDARANKSNAEEDKKESQDSFIQIHALNEYEIGRKQNWRKDLEANRGAALNAEILNNGCKVAKWACLAYLAGVQHIKIGLVTRASAKSIEKHLIFNVIDYETKTLLQQNNLNLKLAQVENFQCIVFRWGIVRLFIESIMQFQDGEYLIYKQPSKLLIKLFEKPAEDDNSDDGGEVNEPTI